MKRKIIEFCKIVLTRKVRLPAYSGIVISGFGETEMLPRLREYAVDIVVDGRVRFWIINKYEINETNGSEVVPLADAGVIRTLTEGISPGFEEEANTGVLKLILAMPRQILDPVQELTDVEKQKYISDARGALVQNFRDFVNSMAKYRNDHYTAPIKQAIASLPVSELSIVAETFLGASQIQKRVNPELETVGGPVDVAVISKGDGFVWIKRKHYFETALNGSFGMRYLEP